MKVTITRDDKQQLEIDTGSQDPRDTGTIGGSLVVRDDVVYLFYPNGTGDWRDLNQSYFVFQKFAWHESLPKGERS